MQYLPDLPGKQAKYKLIIPLLRSGVIEFYGNASYATSPSAFLEGQGVLLGINIDDATRATLKNQHKFQYGVGIDLYERNISVLRTIDAMKIGRTKFELGRLLKQFNSLDSVIKSWPDAWADDPIGFQYFNNHGTWQNHEDLSIGVYRKKSESFAQKLVYIGDGIWKSIPTWSENIDGFNIAVCWSKCCRNDNLQLYYDIEQETFSVQTDFFPIIVERLLFFENCLRSISSELRAYQLKKSHFDLLNRFFNNKIQTI